MSEERVRAVIGMASWAPSGGNEQAWAVTALRPATARAFLDRHERIGWNALLPKLMSMVRRSAGELDDARALELARIKAAQEGLARGAPWLLLVRAPRRTPPDLSWAHRTLVEHLPASECPPLALLEKINGDIDAGVVRASALMFAYALTLAAEAEGLASCIQHMPLAFEAELRAEHGVPVDEELVSTVLLGAVDETDPVHARSRREARRRPVEVDVR